MYRSIVVPLDGSAFAEHALPYALAIARRRVARIYLVQIHTPLAASFSDYYAGSTAQIDSLFHERCRAYLDVIEKKVQTVADLPVSTILADGPVVDTLCGYVDKADLVVMTTHGRGVLSRAWLGSVADDLVRRVAKPILLVRPLEAAVDLGREPALKTIMIPLDGSTLAEQVIEPTIALDGIEASEFVLLRTISPVVFGSESPDNLEKSQIDFPLLLKLRTIHDADRAKAQTYLEAVADRLRVHGIRVRTIVAVHEHPAAAIVDEIRKVKPDLVALATHGRSGLARLYLGSVADKLVRAVHTPILLYRPVQ